MASSQEILKVIKDKRTLLRMAEKKTEMALSICKFVIWKDREDYLSNKLKNFIPAK